jgi:TolB-like protein
MSRLVTCAVLSWSLAALAQTPPTVAVFYFDYDGADADLVPLRKGLAQMLITDLSGREAYTLVEREKLNAALDELKLAATRQVDPAAAVKAGRLLNARYLVLGGFFSMAGALRLDARVFEVETSKLVKGLGATGKPDDFFALEQKLASDLDALLVTLATKEPPKPEAPGGKRALAKSAKGRVPLSAVVAYGKALEAKDAKQPDSAKAQLEAVVKANPDFLLARVDLADLAR